MAARASASCELVRRRRPDSGHRICRYRLARSFRRSSRPLSPLRFPQFGSGNYWLYINSVLKGGSGSGNNAAVMTRSACFVGKSNWSPSGFLHGEISTLTIHSGAMTQAEVIAAYNSAPFTFLEHHWDFKDAQDSYVDDKVYLVPVRATLRRGASSDGTVLGALPTRTANGVVLVGTGPTDAATNAGGCIELSLDQVRCFSFVYPFLLFLIKLKFSLLSLLPLCFASLLLSTS